MRVALASVCAGVSAWCSLGTIGFVAGADTTARIGLLPPWWWLPLIVFACFALVRAARLSDPQLSPLFGSAILLLPWLPVRLPPSAYLWTGPLTGLIWIIVVAAVVQARWPRVQSRWFTDASRAPVVAALPPAPYVWEVREIGGGPVPVLSLIGRPETTRAT